MRNISFTHNDYVYVRINRTKALKAMKKGYTLVVYGANENPNSPMNCVSFWSMGDEDEDSIIGLSWETWVEYTFKRLEDSYNYYNGKAPWWYIGENLANNL